MNNEGGSLCLFQPAYTYFFLALLLQVKIYDVGRKNGGHKVLPHAPVYTICNQFKCQSVAYELETEKPLLSDQPKQPNAFEKLMKNATN